MILGKVVGAITATVNHGFYDGEKLLVVELTDSNFASLGKQMIAIDAVQAGVGDRVLVLDEGNGARQIVADDAAPVRSVIVGIVDVVTAAD